LNGERQNIYETNLSFGRNHFGILNGGRGSLLQKDSLFVIRISKSKKRDKRTNNDLQNTTQKTKDRVTWIPLKIGVNSGLFTLFTKRKTLNKATEYMFLT
jgi:hypothetical protein